MEAGGHASLRGSAQVGGYTAVGGKAGGTENTSIFATVRGSIPNRRAASRRLSPSICTACRTRSYSSTPFIPPPSTKRQKAICCRIVTPAQPDNPAASVRDFRSGAYSHLTSARTHRAFRTAAMDTWHEVTAAAWKAICRRVFTPAQPDNPAASLRDFHSGAYSHLTSARTHRAFHTAAMDTWHEVTAAA